MKNTFKKRGIGYCRELKSTYICTRFTEVGHAGVSVCEEDENIFKKVSSQCWRRRKNDYLCTRFTEVWHDERRGFEGEEKNFKKSLVGSWRSGKDDYLCSPVRKKRGQKNETEGMPSGAAAIYRRFFDVMASRE